VAHHGLKVTEDMAGRCPPLAGDQGGGCPPLAGVQGVEKEHENNAGKTKSR